MNRNPLLEKLAALLSRKFLASLAAQIGAVVTIFAAPATGEAVADAIVKVGGLIALVLAAIGYGAVEASVDRASVKAIAATAGPAAEAPQPTVEKVGGLTHFDTRGKGPPAGG